MTNRRGRKRRVGGVRPTDAEGFEIRKHAEREARARRVRAQVDRWLEDGTTIVGVFECVDLGHPMLGDRVGFAYDKNQALGMRLGQTRAPDNPRYGLGWRYVLQMVSTDPDLITRYVMHETDPIPHRHPPTLDGV